MYVASSLLKNDTVRYTVLKLGETGDIQRKYSQTATHLIAASTSLKRYQHSKITVQKQCYNLV